MYEIAQSVLYIKALLKVEWGGGLGLVTNNNYLQ
jgi:hypothetical protein